MQEMELSAEQLSDRPTPRPPGAPIAASGVRAVRTIERAICGREVVTETAVAEGLALAGHPVALLRAESAGAPTAPSVEAPWVFHRIRPTQPAPGEPMAFELVARDGQQVVDHTLAAHLIARSLGRPGICTLDRSVARRLHVLRLPAHEAIAARAGETAGMDSLTVEEAVQAAFERVAEWTGRDCRALEPHRLEGAQHVVVASGAGVTAAEHVVDTLRAEGVPCGMLHLALARPFPARELQERLREARNIVVLEPEGAHELFEFLRSALGSDAVEREHRIPATDDVQALDGTVRALLGLKPAVAVEPQGDATVCLGVAPGSSWAETLLLEIAGRLGGTGPQGIERSSRCSSALSALVLSDARTVPAADRPIDRLLVADPSMLDVDRLLEAMADHGTLLIDADPSAPELDEAFLSAASRRGIRVCRIDRAPVADLRDPVTDSLKVFLQGALLAADPTSDRLDRSIGQVGESEASLLRAGANALRDAAAAADGPQTRDVAMPEAEGGGDEEWRSALRHFHITGQGAYSADEPSVGAPLAPAVLAAVRREAGLDRRYPFLLPHEGAPAGAAWDRAFRAAIERAEGDGASLPILAEHGAHLASRLHAFVGDGSTTPSLQEAFERARQALPEDFDLSESGIEALNQELETLGRHLPAAEAVGLGSRTLPTLYLEALRRGRREERSAFRVEVETLVHRLEDLLRVDDAASPEARSPDRITGSFGSSADAFLKPERLAQALPRRGSRPLGSERRERIRGAMSVLRRYLAELAETPELFLLDANGAADVVDPSVRRVPHPDGLQAAIGLFDGLAEETAVLLRAVRVARLELAAGYDPALHDAILGRFDWRSFSLDELLLMPAVVVVERAERLEGRLLSSFAALLRSGRPVQVLVAEPIGSSVADHHADLGYLAVAHREAFVLQSSVGQPDHLFRGLQRMARSPRPAVAVAAVPAWDGPVAPWVQLALAQESRVMPCFSYDADAGATWADRFELSGNAQADRAWPSYSRVYRDADGTPIETDEAVTPAHAGALAPELRPQFRVIRTEDWNDDQVEIAEYLAADEDRRTQSLPYIWIVDGNARLARAVVSRRMAYACLDRARAWRVLQELAGTDNEYARRAAEATRVETEAQASETRRRLIADHEGEIEQARDAAAREAIERLVAALIDADTAPPAAAVAPPVEAPPEPTPETPAEAEPQAEVEEEPALAFDEPFIDSVLCTTCHECVNLNSRMFRYDGNKQAYIDDPSQGTFEQLVRAAEKCPARCIHPGVPRDGDATGTPALVARAAPFN